MRCFGGKIPDGTSTTSIQVKWQDSSTIVQTSLSSIYYPTSLMLTGNKILPSSIILTK